MTAFDIPKVLRESPPASDVPGAKTSTDERKLLRFLAGSYVTGSGCIADVGCGTGSSTLALCQGLADNAHVPVKRGYVHAFDRFRRHLHIRQSPRVSTRSEPDTSFLQAFLTNLGAYYEFCVIHEGDICEANPNIGPVELLFVDMAKCRTTFTCIADRFYPSLIPGQSVLVHQDFGRPRLAWLHYSSGYLLPYCEIAGIPVDDTLVLRLVDEIPAHVVDRLVNDDFSTDEKVRYVAALRTALCNMMNGHNRLANYEAILDFASAYVCYWDGLYDEAEARADELADNAFLRDSFGFMFEEIRSRGRQFR